MVLIKYFFKRFFIYFFLINGSFTFLFNFIEFFEKMVRIKHTSIITILQFIGLNIPHSFFENFALSAWLTTCLFIKELSQQNEWVTLKILNIPFHKISSLLLYISIFLGLISIVGKEYIVLNLLNKAETFKIEKFKQNSQKKLINKWIILPQDNLKHTNLFCFFQFLDLKKNAGTGLILLYMNKNFEIIKTLHSTQFSINQISKTLYITKGIMLTSKNSTQKKIKKKNIIIPSFFSQLQLGLQIPTLSMIAKNLISGRKILPDVMLNNLLLQFLTRIISHIHVFLYPLLTFLLFILSTSYTRYKWLIMLLPYPFITLLDIVMNFIIQKGFSAWFIFVFYIFFILFLFIYKKKLEKTC
jgi:lipopolysaccharide export LptBFGC system permease protein LptF